ncbi:MAG: histidine phosphatase family protein [Anaerococcus sp.]|nr:histidine phosphatase family protein [Anaerococcus sp.]
MKIILVRHGQTMANIKWTYSKADTKLAPQGLYILDKTKDLLKDYKIDKVYTSKLARSMETAEKLGYNRYDSDERVNEMNFGNFRGLGIDLVRAEYKEFFEKEAKDYFNITYPGGESRNDVIRRMRDFLDEISKQNYENILVISHGIAIRAGLFWILKDLSNWNSFWIDNGSLTVFNLSEGKKLIESVNKI